MAPLTLVTSPDASRIDVATLVVRAKGSDRAATAELYARHVDRVRRIVARVVGVGPELDDLVQDAFVAAFRRLASLREGGAFASWLDAVAVGEARHHLRAKARRKWLRFFAPEDVPEMIAPSTIDGARDAAKAAQALVGELPVDLRIAFSLRRIDGMQLEEAAAMCRVSLATFKRRLQKAEALFSSRARENPVLSSFFSEAKSLATR